MSEDPHKAPLQPEAAVTITPKTDLDYRQIAASARTILEQRQQLEHANKDTVTLLSTNHQFEEDMTRIMHRNRKPGLVILDLDGLKRANDVSRPTGDKYLQVVAAALDSTKRPDDLAYRIGGDEFAVIMSELSIQDDSQLEDVRNRFAEAIGAQIQQSDLPQDLYLGVSVGVGVAQEDDTVESFRNRVFASEEAHKAGRREALAAQGVVFQDSRRLAN